MLSMKTLIRRIRARLHDTQEIEYDDEDILDCINMGVRFVRRAIVSIRPTLLMSKYEGVIEGGIGSIELPSRPLKIIHVTIGTRKIKTDTLYNSDKVYQNGQKLWKNSLPLYSKKVIDHYSEAGLKQTELAHVIDDKSDMTGKPCEYYLTGTQTINFYPIPREKTKYTIIKVDDIEELTAEDKSPLPNEFDDFLIEYATLRLAMDNEFDMSQEQALMTAIYQQIQSTLAPPPAGFVVNSYW